MASILRISASELVGVGPLVLEQEESMSAQLFHIESIERECKSYGDKLRATLDGISHLSELVKEHIQKSESARNRLRLLTFNSVVEASHLGAKADAICVIADGIAEVSVEWSKISEHSGAALQEILSLSDRINGVIAKFSQESDENLQQAQDKTATGLKNLRSAASIAVMQGKRIETVTDRMWVKSKEIERASQLLHTCFDRIDAVVNVLESMKLDLEADHPGVRQEYDEAEIQRLFSASYTTQVEREVLRSALSGTVFTGLPQYSTGNSVELF
jgi:transcriptional regulator